MSRINFNLFAKFSSICQRNKDDSTGALMAFSEFFQSCEPLNYYTDARLVLLALDEGVNAEVLQVLLSIKPLLLIAEDDGTDEEADEEDEYIEEDEEDEGKASAEESTSPAVDEPITGTGATEGPMRRVFFMNTKQFHAELGELIRSKQIPIPVMKVLAEAFQIDEKFPELVLHGDFGSFFLIANNIFATKYAGWDFSKYQVTTETIQLTNNLIGRFCRINSHNRQTIQERLETYNQIDLSFEETVPKDSLEDLVILNSLLIGVKDWCNMFGISDKRHPEEFLIVLKNYFQ